MTDTYLPLGCFGKLPCYEDFLRGTVLYPTSQGLQDWILAGRETLGMESEVVETARPKETLSRRFLYGAPGSAELVAGVIRPSTDRGGHRSFPFMVYAHLPRRLYGRSYALLPLALGPVWDALDDAWDTLSNVATRAAFEEVVGATLIPGPMPVAEAEASYQVLQHEDVRRMFGGDDDTRIECLRRNMPAVLRLLRKGPEEIRLELPISGGRAPACSDVTFWIDLLNHQFMFRRFEPSVFLEEQGPEKKSRVLLVFGILKATDYPLILGCRGAGEEVSRPARSSEADGRPSRSEEERLSYSSLRKTRFSADGKESDRPGPVAGQTKDGDPAG